MAAVSAYSAPIAPAAGHSGSPYASNNREVRRFDVPTSKTDNDENSDTYSLEARSETSDIGDNAGDLAAAAGGGTTGEAVRPDSLALTSPLEQLTRSLSFNKKDGQKPLTQSSDPLTRNRARPQDNSIAGLPPVEQVMLEYLAAEPDYLQGASTTSYNNQEAPTSRDTTAHSQDSDRKEPSECTSIQPVRFSDDTTRTGGAEDVSDSQGQLINAFRSSYHTYMTRSGGLRDSSYSWMAPDADSPNMTMDFKQAEAVFDAANHKGEAIHLGRYDEVEDDNAANLQENDVSSEWEADDKMKARASSWDSQAAKKMGLSRIPSQKSSKTPTDGRTSDVSTFEPFHYSENESALRAPKDISQKEQVRASNWTSLTDITLPDDTAAPARPLSTIDEGAQTPSLYAYAVDSPSVLQGSFAGPSRVASAAPIPSRSRSQAGRTNFSRPQHDTFTPQGATSVDNQQDVEQLEHPPNKSQLPYADSSQGSPYPARHPYDSVYSAYTQTSEFDTPRAVPQAPFQGAVRPQYSPSSSSHTMYTVQDATASQRPDLQTLESYQRTYEDSLNSPRNQLAPAHGTSTSKKHRRTPSQVLASAISKHRAQRAAAGLTTEGQYYVDPKTKKYYFVVDSGQPGGSTLSASKNRDGKENEKPKERRKLHKKEAGWEVTKVNQTRPASPPRTPQAYERDRSLSLSARSKGSSKGSEDGHGSGSKWKIWSSGRNNGSREHVPQGSPLQPSPMTRDISRPQYSQFGDQDSQELLADRRAPAPYPMAGNQLSGVSSGNQDHPYPSPTIVQIPPTDREHRTPSTSPETRRTNQAFGYSSQGPSSSQGHSSRSPTPHLQPPPNFGYPHVDAHLGHSMERSNSVYSNYSYYEMSSDQGHIPSSRASPVMQRSGSAARTMTSSPNPNVPLASPYIAPSAPEFQPSSGTHSRQPSTTLDKAKHSMQRSGSMQLLATTKHQNLTVPKGDAGRGEDLEELARLNPNDPLVCLHRGIDAHERGDLEESAQLFEQSANGGCGLGMLMFGLALRHGWGCESQPERGFKYLQQAAESVVQNLDRVITGQVQLSEQQLEEQSAKSELVLSIYELGQCFLRGWGVTKDKKTALQYFTLAANLGDPDAQSELGFCYSTGRGCKKDLKKAAKYYRMAAKQGQMTYGMQWIFKSKYDD